MKKLLFILTIVILILPVLSFAGEKEDKEAVVKTFLNAYFKMDMNTVRKHLPAQNNDLFIKYPITGTITYQPAKVSRNQAVVEFSGTTNHSNIPAKGGIIFYKDNGTWKVRQVVFYNSIPKIMGLPSKSRKEDAKFEDEILQKAKDFVAVWQKHDLVAMKCKWYDWTNRNDKQLSTSTKNWTFTHSTLSDGTEFVKYTTDASYNMGSVGYKMNISGGVGLFKEGNTWKVKANHFFFYNK